MRYFKFRWPRKGGARFKPRGARFFLRLVVHVPPDEPILKNIIPFRDTHTNAQWQQSKLVGLGWAFLSFNQRHAHSYKIVANI